MRRTIQRVMVLAGLLLVIALPVMAGITSTETRTVLVNTDATDFTIVAAGTNRSLMVTHIDAQNLGTTGKVTFQICDGPCGAATSKIGPFELSPATASSQGGSYTMTCSGENCQWAITPGNAVIAQVNTGVANNVRVHVTYQYFQR